jgi:hypothetical protein
MYKIVQQLGSKQILLSSITNDSHIGIEWNNGGKCKVITVDSNTFIAIDLKDTELRNKWSRSSKEIYVKSALENNSGTNAYKFDSEEELLEWLLK